MQSVPENKPDWRSPKYYEALGKFVTEFAEVEGMLFATLVNMADISFDFGQAVFSGMRAKNAADAISKLRNIRQTNPERYSETGLMSEDVEECLRKIGAINNVRNGILHYGVSIDSGGKMIARTSHVPPANKQDRYLEVSIETLDNMTSDLRKIARTLLYYGMSTDDSRSAMLGFCEEAMRSAWRHK